MEKKHGHRVGLANISYTQSKEKRTGKKNGSSDLVAIDLGTFRLIRRSSEKSTQPGTINSAWCTMVGFERQSEGFVYNRSCKIIALQPGKRKNHQCTLKMHIGLKWTKIRQQ